MSRIKALLAGVLAGAVAGITMTTAMLLLAWLWRRPLVLIGDRLSMFIPPGHFFCYGKVGGHNYLKQLGVGSTIAGQLLVAQLPEQFWPDHAARFYP
jgi:hypothetical protein